MAELNTLKESPGTENPGNNLYTQDILLNPQAVSLRRSELSPSARDYTDNLYFQITNAFEKWEIKTHADFENAALNKIPLDELYELNRLISGILKTLETGKADFDEEKVKETLVWLNETAGGWHSMATFEELTKNAPKNITMEDLRQVFLKLKPYGVAQEDHDCRGNYLTALGDRVLEDAYKRHFSKHQPTPEEEKKFWEEDAVIELDRPKTDKYDRFRQIGTGWRRGTLILKGDFGKDTNIGYSVKGGKIKVIGDAGPKIGTFMSGGIIEVLGNAGYKAGYYMTGGKIVIHGNAGANVGDSMHDGLIIVKGEIGPFWNDYGQTKGPNTGNDKTGGKIIVGDKEY